MLTNEDLIVVTMCCRIQLQPDPVLFSCKFFDVHFVLSFQNILDRNKVYFSTVSQFGDYASRKNVIRVKGSDCIVFLIGLSLSWNP